MMLFKKPNTPVCHVAELVTFAEKTKGLIGSASPFGAFFRTRFGIHTFGMNREIDVVIADESFCVRAIRRNLPSGKLFFWCPLWRNIFELPAGTAEASGLQKGDSLELRR